MLLKLFAFDEGNVVKVVICVIICSWSYEVLLGSVLKTDISFRETKSTESVSISGDIPLSPEVPFDLQIESHGNALSFLDGLSNDVISWNYGSIDLKLLIRGTLDQTLSNGFLVFDLDGIYFCNLFRNISKAYTFDFVS